MKDEDKTARSSAFTRNDDGLTNTYRTGDSAFLSFFPRKALRLIGLDSTKVIELSGRMATSSSWEDLIRFFFFSGGLEKNRSHTVEPAHF